jgi:DNA-directed RNA polymerase subunit M/transcription elongation factor TFIIS
MDRKIAGRMTFTCSCGNVQEATAEDALIKSGNLHAEEDTSNYNKIIESSAMDPTNKKVKKDCPKCGLDFMTQLRIGENESIVWTCVCGHKMGNT